jgi:hypothetical protein
MCAIFFLRLGRASATAFFFRYFLMKALMYLINRTALGTIMGRFGETI